MKNVKIRKSGTIRRRNKIPRNGTIRRSSHRSSWMKSRRSASCCYCCWNDSFRKSSCRNSWNLRSCCWNDSCRKNCRSCAYRSYGCRSCCGSRSRNCCGNRRKCLWIRSFRKSCGSRSRNLRGTLCCPRKSGIRSWRRTCWMCGPMFLHRTICLPLKWVPRLRGVPALKRNGLRLCLWCLRLHRPWW